MARLLTVNESLDRIVELDGAPVELEGMLGVQPEGYFLGHYPPSARKSDYVIANRRYPPFIILAFGNGSLQPNRDALERWIGQPVRVDGVLHSTPLPRADDPVEYLGLVTPGRITPYSIRRLTKVERRQNDA
jgi:hypothetical protein